MTQQLFQSLFTESPIGVEIFDARGQLLDANPACLEIAGVKSVDGLRHMNLFENPSLTDETKAALRRGETVRCEVEFDFDKVKAANLYPASRSGAIYLKAILTPVGTKNDGGVKGYVVQIEETSQRHRAAQATERALRDSEEQYRLLAENATDGIYRFRLQPPGYEYVSPAMTALFGYEREEWLADPELDHKIVHADDQSLIDRMHSEPTQFVGPVILRCQHKDGHPIWIEHHNAPIFDDGKVIAIQGIVRDVSERLQSMEELERLRNEFLAMVTHELKTPLAAIKGSAATALHSPRPLDPEEGRELFQIIDEQSDRLRDLADNLLDMSRIEAGSLSVKPEPTDLAAVIEEAKATLARAGRSHRIDVEMPDEMPAVNADKRRLVQVLTNLLGNATKFSSPASPITISVEHDAVHATVHVRDRGQGINPAKLPLLFRKFFQVQDGPGVRVGTGLGLAISKGIVEAHGGRIWAESEGEGAGSTFTFTLPLAAEPVARPAAAPVPAPAGVRR
ncbi:MAG: ATP-binding protein, partial [Dehalococcoidia bacterium]